MLDPRGQKQYLPGDTVDPDIFRAQPGRVEELVALGFLVTAKKAKAKSRKEAPVVVGKWRVNPERIRDLPLVDLNLMILEIDNTVPEFEDEQAARDWLSQDFHPA